MTRSRLLPSALALLFALAGCAISNTRAQDMAYEAWNSCPKAANLRLDRIDVNGRIYYTGLNGSAGITELNNCINNYYASHQTSKATPIGAAQGTVVPAALTTTQTATSESSAFAVPTWKTGYEWAYRYESPSGKGTYIWSVDREEVVDGVPHYVVKTGSREIFYRKSDFAASRETVDGAIVVKNTPPRLHYVWPMYVGQTWEQTVLVERPGARQTSERPETATVEAEETVTVPAGTFRTLRVVYRNKKTGNISYEAWYAPELKQVVKLREVLQTGVRTRELTAFKLQ